MTKKSKNNKKTPVVAKVVPTATPAAVVTVDNNIKIEPVITEKGSNLISGVPLTSTVDVPNEANVVKTSLPEIEPELKPEFMPEINVETQVGSNETDTDMENLLNNERTIIDHIDSNVNNDKDEKLLNELEQIESLCMNCHENGLTRFMIHKIPYFRQLIIASFNCDHCGERNNEVTFGGEIQLQGCKYELLVTKSSDLDRQIIKSDSASLCLLEIDFEIPPGTQKGEISTIEGFIRTAHTNLSLYQPARLSQDPELGAKIESILEVLESMYQGRYLPFTIILDDPSGNSFIQNPIAPKKDQNLKIGFYPRTAAQDASLGLQPTTSVYKDDKDSNYKALITGPGFGAGSAVGTGSSNGVRVDADISIAVTSSTGVKSEDSSHLSTTTVTAETASAPALPSVTDSTQVIGTSVYETETEVKLGRSEIVSIPSACPNCSAPGNSMTALTDIPHFKEMVIMAFDCELCGFRNSEIRGGGAVPTAGSQVTLTVRTLDDLKRDVLKSDSCMVYIPELELELTHGTLGGVFTTVEGLLVKISKSLIDNNPFAVGDSTSLQHSQLDEVTETKKKFQIFMKKLDQCSKGEILPFQLILRDPLGNSFISAPLGSFLSPAEDEGLALEDFARSYEENEEFGLNDINTRDFETGVDDAAYEEVVLADRLTQPVRKTVDHPTFFAKGTDDAVPGGKFLQNDAGGTGTTAPSGTSQTSSTVTTGGSGVSGEPWYSTDALPLGWSALKPGEEASTQQQQQQQSLDPENGNDNDHEEVIMNKKPFDSISITSSATATAVAATTTTEYDSHFVTCEKFQGFRPGFVFKIGSQGVGYYRDIHGGTAAATEQMTQQATAYLSEQFRMKNTVTTDTSGTSEGISSSSASNIGVSSAIRSNTSLLAKRHRPEDSSKGALIKRAHEEEEEEEEKGKNSERVIEKNQTESTNAAAATAAAATTTTTTTTTAVSSSYASSDVLGTETEPPIAGAAASSSKSAFSNNQTMTLTLAVMSAAASIALVVWLRHGRR